MLELRVHDDGIGFPMDKDSRQMSSMGMTLVEALAMQISGAVALERTGETQFIITFPG